MSIHREELLSKAVKGPVKVTGHQFYSMLSGHDWFAGFSDDYSVTKDAEEHMRQLEAIAEGSEDFKKLLDGFKAHHFSGESFCRPAVSKPELPEEGLFVEVNAAITDGSRVLMKRFAEEVGGDVWQDTVNIEPPFLLKKIDNKAQPLGVFGSYRDVWHAACFSVKHGQGGHGDVVIENIRVFSSFEQFALE
ncbi:hypothetical protein M2404_003850 [Rheinheimera pacifica]|uniref:hypothetical protein n=1 Tax=Rheinheimera pacifica TaxID=173990 RepID=UPI0021683917|nr:hypothetical protein [Rheinheimera pacifica]MCS4309478.1 hypothetical protein [Rheinheimera pacifica]